MKELFTALLFAGLALAVTGCGSQARSNPGVDVSGNWNIQLTEQGQSSPTFAFGMALTMNTSNIYGTLISYTGGTQPTTMCINYANLALTGTTNNGSQLTMSIVDTSTNSNFTVNAKPNSAVTEMVGSYNAVFGANGSNPACAAQSGTVLFAKQ